MLGHGARHLLLQAPLAAVPSEGRVDLQQQRPQETVRWHIDNEMRRRLMRIAS